MKRFLQIVWIVAGAALTLDAAVLFATVPIHIGLAATLLAGLFLLGRGIFYRRIDVWTTRGAWKWVKYIVYAGMVFAVGVMGMIATYGRRDTVTYREEAVIVLGAGLMGEEVTLPLAYRLDSCLEYLEQNPEAVVVVSGGRGAYEDISEALAMERYLVQKGVDPSRIIKEERSTSTFENFRFSKSLLDQRFSGRDYHVAFITNNFHIYRAEVYAKMAGLSATYKNAEIQWYVIPVNYIREFLAVMKLWVFRN